MSLIYEFHYYTPSRSGSVASINLKNSLLLIKQNGIAGLSYRISLSKSHLKAFLKKVSATITQPSNYIAVSHSTGVAIAKYVKHQQNIGKEKGIMILLNAKIDRW